MCVCGGGGGGGILICMKIVVFAILHHNLCANYVHSV